MAPPAALLADAVYSHSSVDGEGASGEVADKSSVALARPWRLRKSPSHENRHTRAGSVRPRVKTTAKSSRGQHIFGATAFLLVTAALIWRLPLGIDLSDESYYAIFIDDWMKGGIASSTLATIHQTALLTVYPAIKVFAAVSGSSDGLVLALRCLFLIGSIVTALTWLIVLRRVTCPVSAWFGALFALSFIPFGLPSVSYNTLGIQGLSLALASLGTALAENRLGSFWSYLSAIGWALAVVSYPSLALALVTSVVILLLMGQPISSVLRYLAPVVVAQLLAWSFVTHALSFEKLHASFLYLAAINDVAGWSRKAEYSLAILQRNPTFSIACTCAILLGLLRHRIGHFGLAMITALLIALLFTGPIALFCRSHDVVTVVALTGVGYFFHLGADRAAPERAIAFVWASSFAAGLVTMASAFNSLINFPIAAAPAAVAALVGCCAERKLDRLVQHLTQAVAVLSVLIPSLTFYYGDLPNAPLPATKVTHGAFAGLAGQPEQVDAIQWMRDNVSPLIGQDGRIAFIGRLYGLILATPARPLMLAVFPLSETMNPKGLAMSSEFFENPEHRPSLVIVHRDHYVQPLNPIRQFKERYEEFDAVERPLGTFMVFRRRD